MEKKKKKKKKIEARIKKQNVQNRSQGTEGKGTKQDPPKKKGILSIQTPASGKTGKPYCQYCSVLQSPHVKEAAEVKTNESESHRILSKALEASCSFTSLQSREEADLII